MVDATDYLPTPVKNFFFPEEDPNAPPPTPAAMEARRRMVAAILARRQQPYPKTFGEGLTALGEGIADRARMQDLDRQEARYSAALQKRLTASPVPGAQPAAVPAPAPQASEGGGDAPDEEDRPNPVLSAVNDYQTNRDADPYNPPPAPGALSPGQYPSGTQLVPYNGPPAAPGAFGTRPDASGGAGAGGGGGGGGPAPPDVVRNQITQALMPPPMRGAGVPYLNPTQAGAVPTMATPAAVDTTEPPTVRRDIAPAPTAGAGLTTAPSPRLFQEPAPPILDTRPTKEEVQGMTLMRQFAGDKQAEAAAQQLIAYGQSQRKAKFDQETAAFNQRRALFASEFENRYAREEAERVRGAAAPTLTNEEFKAASDDYIKNKRPVAEKIAEGQDAIRQARLALSSGAITGIGAEARINWGRLMSLMGRPDLGKDAANAQAFGILMQPVTNAQRAAASGNQQISNADILMAKMASGSDVSLEPKTIFHLLNVLEENGLKHLQDYKERAGSLFGTDVNPRRAAIYGAPAFDTEPQKLPPPPDGQPARVWTPTDARRYPRGTPLIIMTDGSRGFAP